MKTLKTVLAAAQAASEWMYDDDEYLREEARAKVRHRRELLAEASPEITAEDIERLALGTEVNTHSMRAVKTWMQRLTAPDPQMGPRRILVLLGGKGCGKTVAASWALTRDHGRYITTDRLLLVARSRRPEHLSEHDAVLRTKVLVLDEAGAESDQPAVRALVLGLLNRRQSGQLTIITSNLDEVSFHAWLDERALSRLMQLGQVWRVTGDDMRLRGAA